MAMQGFEGRGTPDGVHFGSMYLYREWEISTQSVVFDITGDAIIAGKRSEVWLSAVAVSANWQPGWNTATHRSYDGYSSHEAPVADCTCGFWAYWLPEHIENTWKGPFVPYAFGAVEISGRMRYGELGARAEKARIAAIALPEAIDGKGNVLLRRKYPDVRVYRNPMRLIEDFPPTDTRPFLGMTAVEAAASVLDRESGSCHCPLCADKSSAYRVDIPPVRVRREPW